MVKTKDKKKTRLFVLNILHLKKILENEFKFKKFIYLLQIFFKFDV